MATTLYRSTDASAPTLNGTAGSLITVLDACLVNGYGAKAAAGWAKSFSGTNKAAYRAPAGTRFYLRVLDDGSDAGNGAKVATIRGYVSMTDVDTGAEPYPTVAQAADGLFIGKSNVADASARPWFVLADSKRVIIATAYFSSYTEAFMHAVFGDLVGATSADAYASVILGATTTGNATGSAVAGAANRGNLVWQTVASGLYAPRAASGAGTSAAQATLFPSSSTSGSGASSFPVGPDGAGNIWGDPVQVGDGANAATAAPRGYFPGLLFLRNYLDYGTYPSFTAFGSKQVVRFNSSHANAYLIDTGDWE